MNSIQDSQNSDLDFQSYISALAKLGAGVAVSDIKGTQISPGGALQDWMKRLRKVAESEHNKVIFIGNGGSAGISSHCAIDYTKNGGIRAQAFNDASALTCLSNDYAYEDAFAKQIQFYGFKGDLLIAISSSGRSANIVKAVEAARAKGLDVITLSGFGPDNPLRERGDINFFVASNQYGFVEILHLTIIHCALDLFMGMEPARHQGVL